MRLFSAACATCGFQIEVKVEGVDTDDAEVIESQGVASLTGTYRGCPGCHRKLNVKLDGKVIQTGDPEAKVEPRGQVTSLGS